MLKSGRKGLKRKSFLIRKVQTPKILYVELVDKCYPLKTVDMIKMNYNRVSYLGFKSFIVTFFPKISKKMLKINRK